MLMTQRKLVKIIEHLVENAGSNVCALNMAQMLSSTMVICSASDSTYSDRACIGLTEIITDIVGTDMTPGDEFEIMINMQGGSNAVQSGEKE